MDRLQIADKIKGEIKKGPWIHNKRDSNMKEPSTNTQAICKKKILQQIS